MATEKPKNSEPSFTGDWNKDVGTWKNEKEKQRTHFYTQSALLSLRVDNESDIAEALRHPKENKISTLEEIKSGELSMHKIKEGEVLQSFLKRFYKNIKNGADKHRDLKVTLYELTKQHMNVDFIRAGNTVEIVNGEIIFYKGNGDELARYLLRQGSSAVEVKKVEPVVPRVVKKTPPVVQRKPLPVDTPPVIVKRAKPRPVVEDDEPDAPLPIAKAPKPVAEKPKPKPVAAPAPESVAKVSPVRKPVPVAKHDPLPSLAPSPDENGSFTISMDPPAPKSAASSEPLEAAEQPAPVVVSAPVSAPADDGSPITVALDPAVTAELPHAEPALPEPIPTESRKNVISKPATLFDLNKYIEPLSEEESDQCLDKWHEIVKTIKPESGTKINLVAAALKDVESRAWGDSGRSEGPFTSHDGEKKDLRGEDRKFVQWLFGNTLIDPLTRVNALIWLSNSYFGRSSDAKADRAPDFNAEKGRAYAEMALHELDTNPIFKNEDTFKDDLSSLPTKRAYAGSLRAFALGQDGYQNAALSQYKEIVRSTLDTLPLKDVNFISDNASNNINDYFNYVVKTNDSAVIAEAKPIALKVIEKTDYSLSAVTLLKSWWRTIATRDERAAELPSLLNIPRKDIDVFAASKNMAPAYHALMEGKTTPFDKANKPEQNRIYWLLDIATSYGMQKENLERKKELYREVIDLDGFNMALARQGLSAVINQGFYNNTYLRGSERGVQSQEKEVTLPDTTKVNGIVVDSDYLYFDSLRKIAIPLYVNTKTREVGKPIWVSIDEKGFAKDRSTDRPLFDVHTKMTLSTEYRQMAYDPMTGKLVPRAQDAPPLIEERLPEFIESLEKKFGVKVTQKNDQIGDNHYFVLTFDTPVTVNGEKTRYINVISGGSRIILNNGSRFSSFAEILAAPLEKAPE